MRKPNQNFVMKHFFLAVLISLSLVSFGRIVPAFTCDALTGCSPLVVHITDQSSGGVTAWSWDLGNGNTSTQQNPSATYFNPGRYIIKLVVSDGTNTDSTFQVVMVFAKPIADFTSNRVTACPNDSVLFTSLAIQGDAPINHYAWGFGNGIANNNMSAAYQYPTAGIYDVTLVIQDTNGCVATVTKPSYIRIWPSPNASFTAYPLLNCGISQNVTFVNQSQGNGLSYLWQFKDSANSISTLANPSHVYPYGNYRPKLTVTDSNGCSSDWTYLWVKTINLIADFQANKTRICAGESINFNSLSPSSGQVWYWNFGDGTTSNKQNPKHIYAAPGVYSVTFVITDGLCHDSITKTAYITVTQGFTLAMSANQRNSCSTPFTVNFSYTASTSVHCIWDFGNGSTDTTANPSTTYTNPASYSVTLTAIDSNGCTITLASPGLINTSKPKPSFSCDTLVCPGEMVKFKNNSRGGTHYLWNFGDGDTSTVSNPTHIYASYGSFTVSLTAMDSSGCDSTLARIGAVRIDSTHVDFKVDDKFSPCPPLVSQFTNLSNRPDLKYKWDFGDGYTDTAANPTHIFFHPGLFTVKLIGTSKQGCTDTIVYPDLVLVQGPIGHFSLTPTSGCVPLVVNFTGNVSSNTQTITCDLGNGILYNDSLNFSYTYNSVTSFHPKYVLTDHVGCTVPYDLDTIKVHPLPALNLKDTAICPGQPVHMVLGTDMYSWTGKVCDTCGRIPNITDTVAIANLTPQVTTNYTVNATNMYGCTSTGRFSLNVVQLPSLTTPDTIRMCKNETTQLGLGQADSVQWTPATYLSNPTVMSPICSAPVSMTYNVTAYNRLGCSISKQVPLKVLEKVKVSLMPDTAACPGTSLQLLVTAIDTSVNGSTSYSWSPALSMNNNTVSNPVAQIGAQTETFQVITRSSVCVADTSTVTVSVKPGAIIKLPASVLTTPHSDIPLAPVSDNLVSYQWTAKDSLTCSNCESTTLVPITSQLVYLSGENEYGCKTTDSMKINIIPCDPSSIFVPNTFSPNGDGLHDVLYVRSRALSHMDYFRVFDRWGSIVYEGRDMNEGWDGTINGKAAEQGVYVYTVSGKCESGFDVETSGTTTLIR